ncbi:hypothetical protein ACFLUU_01615 [Chloroflexota bacterium]
MTIIASVKARDGIVLATDSMSQLIGRTQTGQLLLVKTYCNAKKLFRIRQLPIGVMSYGLGSIGERSIENLILEFSRDLGEYCSEPYTVETISRGLYKFISGLYGNAFSGISIEDRQKNLRLGFFVSGYSPSQFLAEEWEFELPKATDIKQVRTAEKLGVSWRGIPVPFGRLFNGFDPRIADELVKAGVSKEVIKSTLDPKKWRMPVAYNGMPVQDAINFAVYILETTIGAVTIEQTPAPSCGGPLQVAVILPDKGWEWIHEPQLTIE